MKTKTTIELPEELTVAAKRRAAEQRTTLRTLIEHGLRAQLRGGRMPRAASKAIKWITVDGGLPPGIDVAGGAAALCVACGLGTTGLGAGRVQRLEGMASLTREGPGA